MEKQCFKCRATKPLSEFYRHAQMADGHLNKCKSCARSDSISHRNGNIERVKVYDRVRSNSDTHRQRNRESYRKRMTDPRKKVDDLRQKREWYARNKIKTRANVKVKRALEKGILVRRNECERCGSGRNIHAHHEDYTKPLDVNWLCQKCHGLRHREINASRRGFRTSPEP